MGVGPWIGVWRGDGDGVGEGLGVGEGDGLGDGLGVGEGDGVGVGDAGQAEVVGVIVFEVSLPMLLYIST